MFQKFEDFVDEDGYDADAEFAVDNGTAKTWTRKSLTTKEHSLKTTKTNQKRLVEALIHVTLMRRRTATMASGLQERKGRPLFSEDATDTGRNGLPSRLGMKDRFC